MRHALTDSAWPIYLFALSCVFASAHAGHAAEPTPNPTCLRWISVSCRAFPLRCYKLSRTRRCELGLLSVLSWVTYVRFCALGISLLHGVKPTATVNVLFSLIMFQSKLSSRAQVPCGWARVSVWAHV